MVLRLKKAAGATTKFRVKGIENAAAAAQSRRRRPSEERGQIDGRLLRRRSPSVGLKGEKMEEEGVVKSRKKMDATRPLVSTNRSRRVVHQDMESPEEDGRSKSERSSKLRPAKPKLVYYDDDNDFEDGKKSRGFSRESKEKTRDKRIRNKGEKLEVRGSSVNCYLKESEEGKVKADVSTEEKRRKFPTRLLDKKGKMKRVDTKTLKSSDDRDAETPPVKKKKRAIKIDPYDLSNKRLDDGTPPSAEVPETKIEVTKNAQFRAIQPSSSILSLVEENLLGRRRLSELQNAGYNVKISAPLDNIPFSTSSERERIEENVFRSKLEFFAAAKISSSFPPPSLPEIAFAGRSNVGKSSLMNALTRQWGVVRTSDKPGLTQTINFFRLASKLCLVDLPGYGFAYAKEEVKDAWEDLVKEYVSTRVGLERVCLLIDAKWGMKPRDHELIDLMERSKTPYQVVVTKTDLVFPIDVARRAMQIQENLKKNKSLVNPVMMVSSKSGAGLRTLRSVLAKLARFKIP